MALSPVPLACVPEAWPGEDANPLLNSKLNKTSSYIAQPADEIFIVDDPSLNGFARPDCHIWINVCILSPHVLPNNNNADRSAIHSAT